MSGQYFRHLCLILAACSLSLIAHTEAHRSLLADPGISLAGIESDDGLLPATKPVGFTYEPILPEFYKLINNVTYYEFNGTYYEDIYGNGTFVEAIASTVNGTFTLIPVTSIEAAGSDGKSKLPSCSSDSTHRIVLYTFAPRQLGRLARDEV